MAEESALIFIAPGDSIDAIEQKIRGASNESVQLLVPDDTTALQALGGFARLRDSLQRDHIQLLVISSDEKTLNAARLNQVDTVGVEGVRVPPPPTGNGGRARSYATQVLPSTTGAPIAKADAEFLDALDNLPPQSPYDGEEDADIYAALDDLSDTFQSNAAPPRSSRAQSSSDDDFAAALDEWSTGESLDRIDDDFAAAPEASSTSPRRRVRPEDLELSSEDISRQRGARRSATTRPRAEAQAESEIARPGRRRPASTRWSDEDEFDEIAARPPRRTSMSTLIILAIILILLVGGAIWFLRSRATIEVALPVTSTSSHQFSDEIIPIVSNGQPSADAVLAVPVNADASFSVTGQVTEETLSPAGAAKGTVTVINRVAQPIPLPEGTQFIAVKEDGQEVRFKIDQATDVPAATTTTSLTGSSTSFGQVDAAITALSPGAASNISENAIQQILIPGQDAIKTDVGNFILRNAPITGGQDMPQRIVTDADVQRTLQEALTGLYNAGLQALQGQIDQSTQGIDSITILPSPTDLGDPNSYELAVEPAIGQTVDANNPVFQVTVKAHFMALSAPAGQMVGQQLQTAVPEHLKQRADLPCTGPDASGLAIDSYHWDGEKLSVNATLTCTPSQQLSAETISQVKSAVAGQSREQATQNLEALKQSQLIGDYVLPADRESFPSYDFLLTVHQATIVTEQPATGEPTTVDSSQPEPTAADSSQPEPTAAP